LSDELRPFGFGEIGGEVCEDLQIAQSTFYEWRTKGTGPRCIKLPNGQLRVRRADLEAWLGAREDAA